MDESPKPSNGRAGWRNLLWIAVPALLFAVRAGLWWRDWSRGKITVATMTGWDWVRIVLYHLAVIGGVILLVGMIVDRTKAPPA